MGGVGGIGIKDYREGANKYSVKRVDIFQKIEYSIP